jgi:hypothetical protein
MEIGQHGCSRVVPVVVGDRVLKLAAVAAQLERGQRVQGVVRLVYGWLLAGGDGGHRRLFLRASGDVISLPKVPARSAE